jgi:D-alanine transaminase/branched-chain amino acid aminotransferase
MSTLYCYINKQFVAIEKAGVSVTDLLVQRGYGIFDYLRVADNKPLFLEDHLERFYNSANIMRLQVKETKEEILAKVYELIKMNNLAYSGIRLIIGGGDSADGYTIFEPSLMIVQQPIPTPPDTMNLAGIKLVTKDYQRQLARVKTTDYLMAIHLQPWMKEQGADDILYYSNGIVRECPRSNFFMIKNGTIITATNNMLLGITRKNIIKIANENNIPVEERDFTLEELKTADEAFISSSTKRVTAVKQIDDYILPTISDQSIAFRLFALLKEKELK